MGEIVEFASNGSTAHGYLAPASSGAGPGVIVIQEWWGLVPHIHDVCDRFAAEGITALAPDLYRGEQTTEPDEAGKLMMALNIDEAADHMSGAVDFLGASEHVHGDGVPGAEGDRPRRALAHVRAALVAIVGRRGPPEVVDVLRPPP